MVGAARDESWATSQGEKGPRSEWHAAAHLLVQVRAWAARGHTGLEASLPTRLTSKHRRAPFAGGACSVEHEGHSDRWRRSFLSDASAGDVFGSKREPTGTARNSSSSFNVKIWCFIARVEGSLIFWPKRWVFIAGSLPMPPRTGSLPGLAPYMWRRCEHSPNSFWLDVGTRCGGHWNVRAVPLLRVVPVNGYGSPDFFRRPRPPRPRPLDPPRRRLPASLADSSHHPSEGQRHADHSDNRHQHHHPLKAHPGWLLPAAFVPMVGAPTGCPSLGN